MANVEMTEAQLEARKRQNEFRRYIRRLAKKQKLGHDVFARMPRVPRRSSTVSTLYSYRTTYKPTVGISPISDRNQRFVNKNESYFAIRAILESRSQAIAAHNAEIAAANRPPTPYWRKPSIFYTPPNVSMVANVPIEKLAVDYLKIIRLNIRKHNCTIPKELKARFRRILDKIVSKYVSLNPDVPANFIKAGLRRDQYVMVMDRENIPLSVSLENIIDEVRSWVGLPEEIGVEDSDLIMVSVWIPGPSEDHDTLFNRIKEQNPDLNTELWRLYHAEYLKTEEQHGQWLVLGIDQKSRKRLALLGCKAKCEPEGIQFVVPPFAKQPSDSDSEDSDYPIRQDSD